MDQTLALLGSVLGIIVIDLVLSGDNAVVIGMAARRLPPKQRRLAIILGGGAAIGLRILFAAIATLLLQVPLLQAVGGLLLLWVAWRLLREGDSGGHEVAESVSIVGAMQTIILADVVMSLDNILAIAGVAHGNIALLLFGLIVSMPLILFGSGLIAIIMNRMPWLVYIGAGILTWTAGQMVAEDRVLSQVLHDVPAAHWLLPIIATVAILGPFLVKALLLSRKQVERV